MMIETTEQETTEAANEDGLFDRIWQRVKDTINPPTEDAPFSVYKSLSGELRWLATFTNNFMDRDKEIISEKAIDGYLARLDMGLVPMPELWEAHIPETKLGQADMVFAVGNFLHADGHFDNTPENERAIQYYRKNAPKIPLSHGFTFPNRALKNGVYEEMNTFEVTLLPPPLVASNPFTDLEVNDSMKQITPEQKTALSQSRGSEYVEKLIAERETKSKELVEAGVAYKDFADVAGAEVAAETETPAEEQKPNPIAQMLIDILESQNELMSLVTDNGKAFAAYRAQMDAKVKELTDANVAQKSATEKLQAELKLTPRAASTAAETKLSDKEAAALKADAEKSEADPFWNVGV